MATLVMKFGGSLTANAKQLLRATQVISGEALAWPHMVVVVSARAGTTDRLNRTLDMALARNAAAYRREVASLRREHLELIDGLFRSVPVRAHLTRYLDQRMFDVLALCDHTAHSHEVSPRSRDAVMAVGEQIMTHILTELVQQEGVRAAMVEAEQVIITDGNHQNAHPLMDQVEDRVEAILRPLLSAKIIPLLAGYIGATRTGVLTTLGRGGSDLTATILAASLRADEVWMWTSVDGIMSADPALVPGARVIPVLSYGEVSELAFFGTRILHPAAIEPLIPHGIPLRVRNPANLDHAGTLIQAEPDESGATLKAVTAVDGVYLAYSGQAFDLMAFLGKVQDLVGSMITGPVMVMQGHHRAALVFVVPTSEGPRAAISAAQRLSAGLPRWTIQAVKVVAAIGAPPNFTLTAKDLHPLASAVGTGGRHLLAVQPAEMQIAVRHLHSLAGSNPPKVQVWPLSTHK